MVLYCVIIYGFGESLGVDNAVWMSVCCQVE